MARRCISGTSKQTSAVLSPASKKSKRWWGSNPVGKSGMARGELGGQAHVQAAWLQLGFRLLAALLLARFIEHAGELVAIRGVEQRRLVLDHAIDRGARERLVEGVP